MSFKIEQYSVADFISFNRNKGIELNPKYQRRGGIWSDSMQIYLIDTILREMSIPKIYFRTKINTKTLTSTRDVVDGQQRLRAIFRFADNQLVLSSKAGEFRGKSFADLTEDQKETFLGYMISTEHILSADDNFAVQVFSRLNQTGVKLNHAEQRNAQFDSEFKWFIVRLAKKLIPFFLGYEILSIKEQIRMIDDELTAEIFMLVEDGIEAGTSASLARLYKKYDNKISESEASKQEKVALFESTGEKILLIINDIQKHLDQNMQGNFSSRTHLVMLFAAMYNAKYGIPYWKDSGLNKDDYKYPESTAEWSIVSKRLQRIDEIISENIEPSDDKEREFLSESKAATINSKSRRIRFPMYAGVFKEYA